AVADVVLLPQWELTREELAAVIGQQAAAGATNEQAVAQALAMPTDFGSQTGVVRGVLAGAREMQLSPAELERLARLTRDGLRQAVQDELLSRGHRPALVQEFTGDLAALPEAMRVPQTTAAAWTKPALEKKTTPKED
ncbi:MAG: hypothetical protein L0322_26010, partial [Chloroflexi bacterium]|nr:hypothetical protein [Chloroflexota bacterium]